MHVGRIAFAERARFRALRGRIAPPDRDGLDPVIGAELFQEPDDPRRPRVRGVIEREHQAASPRTFVAVFVARLAPARDVAALAGQYVSSPDLNASRPRVLSSEIGRTSWRERVCKCVSS